MTKFFKKRLMKMDDGIQKSFSTKDYELVIERESGFLYKDDSGKYKIRGIGEYEGKILDARGQDFPRAV